MAGGPLFSLSFLRPQSLRAFAEDATPCPHCLPAPLALALTQLGHLTQEEGGGEPKRVSAVEIVAQTRLICRAQRRAAAAGAPSGARMLLETLGDVESVTLARPGATCPLCEERERHCDAVRCATADGGGGFLRTEFPHSSEGGEGCAECDAFQRLIAAEYAEEMGPDPEGEMVRGVLLTCLGAEGLFSPDAKYSDRWVVRAAPRFGARFALYADDPAFVHSR